MVETAIAPYRGERIIRQIPVKIPTSASKGTLRILVSDGETLDRVGRGSPAFGRRLDLASTIALLNKEHSNNRVYVSLLEADPEARVADKVMPTLPISIMNVMDGMRGNQEMLVSGESNVDETATAPLDYVVSGAQLLTITVKERVLSCEGPHYPRKPPLKNSHEGVQIDDAHPHSTCAIMRTLAFVFTVALL